MRLTSALVSDNTSDTRHTAYLGHGEAKHVHIQRFIGDHQIEHPVPGEVTDVKGVDGHGCQDTAPRYSRILKDENKLT